MPESSLRLCIQSYLVKHADSAARAVMAYAVRRHSQCWRACERDKHDALLALRRRQDRLHLARATGDRSSWCRAAAALMARAREGLLGLVGSGERRLGAEADAHHATDAVRCLQVPEAAAGEAPADRAARLPSHLRARAIEAWHHECAAAQRGERAHL